MNALQHTWQKRFFRWLDRRMEPAGEFELRRDKLYILPTKIGFAFSVLIAILWMLGTNYQNNLILGLCLLMASVFVLVILRTHNNLAGLHIQFKSAESGFAGDVVAFRFTVTNRNRQHKDNIRVAWHGQEPTTFAVDRLASASVTAHCHAPERGYLLPRRLLVETIYPLGLFRCWSWLNLEARAVIYPRPEKHRELAAHQVDGEEHALTAAGGEDFAGLRDYHRGDPLKHVAWKHYARGQGFMSKEFSSGASNEIWLSWQSVEGLATEQRLSTLCYWVLHHDQAGDLYGLDIPGARLAPAQGPQHRHQVLSALALFGQKEHRLG